MTALCGVAAVSAAAQSCHMDVLVAFNQPPVGKPPKSVMADIARQAQVRLSYRRSIGSRFQLLGLATREPDPGCSAALVRLREDPRIRSVDPDARRQVHGQ